ncbi:MAG: GNAT family N-acetyltransferase [Oscillospiraceae bacterium]|nr:GNAT family N-acetyltransferase [Oscillospiraceae bacterium]
MASYLLVTDRMYMKLAHPRLAAEVARFNERNKAILREVEPMRPSIYYTKSGMKLYLKQDYRDAMKGNEFRYYLTLKGEKKIIGTVCIGSIHFGSVKSCVLSYKMDKDYRNMGLCSEAVEEIIRFAFEILRLHRIEAQVMPRNAKSLAIMRKFNFEKEGLLKKCLEINGQWEDHYVFSLLNDKISAMQHYD